MMLTVSENGLKETAGLLITRECFRKTESSIGRVFCGLYVSG